VHSSTGWHYQLVANFQPPTTNSQITRLESVAEQGKTHYEGQVQSKAGKTVVLELDADGKAIKK
jgi:hypothetical protein